MGYRIKKIVDKINSGEIRIPAFQRGFVWDPERVAFLMDSLYKGFPIGSILLWRTTEMLKTEKQLGNFQLPEPQKNYPIDYVLDGQQRLTSIFSVFQTDMTPINDGNWLDIYYLIGSNASIQKSKFVALPEKDVESNKHFPLSVLFDSVKYRQATDQYNDAIKIELDKLQGKFQDVDIPNELMETDDKEHVAIVFERINRAGMKLDSFQLLSAWSWSTDFDLQDELNSLSYELEDFEFGDLMEEQELLLKCFTGYILNDTSPAAILNLDGTKVRENFEQIKNGIKSAIDFLQKELKVYSLKFMPYPAMIVSLTKFFGTSKKNGKLYTDKQRKELIRWFWRNCFSRRYTSGVNDAHESDLNAMQKLIDDENFCISNFKCDIIETFFTQNQFGINAVNTKTFIIMLANNIPKSFISGSNVDLSKVLKNASSKEFHHIFPDKYLQNQKLDKKKIYMLANFCFLNNADNQKIKDKSPKEYKKLINSDSLVQIMESALCPQNALDLSYDEFINKRAEILLECANDLIN